MKRSKKTRSRNVQNTRAMNSARAKSAINYKDAERNLHQVEDTIAAELIQGTTKDKLYLDQFIYIVGILAPVFTIFQVISIYTHQTQPLFSMLVWGGFMGVATMWFCYGIAIKYTPIIIAYGLWMITTMIVFAGVYFYSL